MAVRRHAAMAKPVGTSVLQSLFRRSNRLFVALHVLQVLIPQLRHDICLQPVFAAFERASLGCTVRTMYVLPATPLQILKPFSAGGDGFHVFIPCQ